jgi:hypothetical protein
MAEDEYNRQLAFNRLSLEAKVARDFSKHHAFYKYYIDDEGIAQKHLIYHPCQVIEEQEKLDKAHTNKWHSEEDEKVIKETLNKMILNFKTILSDIII